MVINYNKNTYCYFNQLSTGFMPVFFWCAQHGRTLVGESPSFASWMNGYAIACALCSSSIGAGVRPCIGSYAPWVRVQFKPLGWRVMPAAGGVTAAWS